MTSGSRNLLKRAAGRTRRTARRLQVPLLRELLAGRFDASSVRVITSSPRSGSTWLAQVLSAAPGSCVLFEPLHLDYVPEARLAGFTWRTYVAPDASWPQGEAFLQRVFEGRVINAWTSSEMSLRQALRARTLLVKFVRANRLLPWMCRRFPLRPPVLLLRHPCAVVASQLRSEAWRNAERPGTPPFMGEFPALAAALERTSSVEEFLAARWALDQIPCLWSAPPHPWLTVTYEEMVLRPAETIRRVAEALDLPIDIEVALARHRRPSRAVHDSGISGLSGWQRQLSATQVRRILATVEALGLRFYTQEPEPDLQRLASAAPAS